MDFLGFDDYLPVFKMETGKLLKDPYTYSLKVNAYSLKVLNEFDKCEVRLKQKKINL